MHRERGIRAINLLKMHAGLLETLLIDTRTRACARARGKKVMLNEWRLMNGNFRNGSSHLKAKFRTS